MFGYPPCWPRNEVHYALLHSRSSLTFEKLKPVKYMLVGIDCDCGQTVAWLAILRGHNLATFACHLRRLRNFPFWDDQLYIRLSIYCSVIVICPALLDRMYITRARGSSLTASGFLLPPAPTTEFPPLTRLAPSSPFRYKLKPLLSCLFIHRCLFVIRRIT